MKLSLSALSAAALVVAAGWSTAQIERLDLPSMVAKTDNCVYGTIVKSEVIRIDHKVDGPELYYTLLTIEGRSLQSNEEGTQNLTTTVIFPGGFVSKTEGVRNSEAPASDEIKVGNKVVAFYKYSPNMGGDLAGNALYASHGGLYTTFERNGKSFVQGRGDGYAIPTNQRLDDLSPQIASLALLKK